MSILSHLFKLRDKANKSKNPEEDEKPFLAHLEDLRKMFVKIVITLLVTTILAFVFNKQLLEVIKYPLTISGIPDVLTNPDFLSVLSPVESFTTLLKICFYAGIIAGFPFLLVFIGEFVLPGLNEKEKKLVVPVVSIGFFLFLVGVLFAFFVVNPKALGFFYTFGAERGIKFDLRLQYYVSFITQMTLVFGLCFELPVVVMAFVKLELLSYQLMRDTRSYAIVIIAVVAAIATPTPDAFTLSLVAGPMIVLYEICIWLAYFMEKKRKRAEEAEQAADRERLARIAAERKAASEKAAAIEAETPTPVPTARPETREFSYDPANEIPHTGGDTSEDVPPRSESQQSSVDRAYDHEAEAKVDDAPTTPEETIAHDDPETLHHGDDVWKADDDPYQHDHHDHYHDSYYSGPTEELKRMLREELKDELKGEIKAEVRDELLVILRKELGIKLTPEGFTVEAPPKPDDGDTTPGTP